MRSLFTAILMIVAALVYPSLAQAGTVTGQVTLTIPDPVPGPAGKNGTNGRSMFSGPDAPASTLGQNGDLYLNTATGDLYRKSTGWQLVGNIKGPKGDPGIAGANGVDGKEGANGKDGANGAPGAEGAAGPPGPAGPLGPQGLAGMDGAIGPSGPQGIAGPAGAVGAVGAPGPQGIAGAVGPRGATGATGATGPAGPQGPAGKDGVSPTVDSVIAALCAKYPTTCPTTTGGGPATGTATVTWTAPTQNTDGSPLTNLAGYVISYGTAPSSLGQSIPLNDASATSYVFTNLAAGNTWYFSLYARSATGAMSDGSPPVSKTL
jgi:collagen triple helix repeat protein/fibronectin type III domain protein